MHESFLEVGHTHIDINIFLYFLIRIYYYYYFSKILKKRMYI
jgi:hypothetical protein